MDDLNFLDSTDIKSIHFIGIGGSSMSGLAEILLKHGYRISGSDVRLSAKTQKLEQLGAKIYENQCEENIKNPDLVVYTAAISKTDPELLKAKSLGIPTIERATLLGLIMKKYPYSVGVSGTHGKTTTTSMVSMIMLESGLDPSIHIGGELSAIGGGTRSGNSKYFVTEACEYVDSFLQFHPFLAVILNIEADHLDYFKDIEQIKNSFYRFASLVPSDGYVVACADDPNVIEVLDKLSCNKITFGIKSSNAVWSAANIQFNEKGCASYMLLKNGGEAGEIHLSVPGIHNVTNSLAAAASCYTLGCSIQGIQRGLALYSGARKRFEIKGVKNDIIVVDDYAHHPSEIQATLRAAKQCSRSKIWCIFQPHTYTRTKALLEDFAASFVNADTVIVTDIYAAREVDQGEIHSTALVDRINRNSTKAIYMPDFENIADFLDTNACPGDMIITMGAGDICSVGEIFLEHKNIAVNA